MTVIELLNHLRQLNIELWVEDDRLRFRAPPGVLTPDLRAMLAEHKAQVIAFLKLVQDSAQQSGPIPLSFAQQRLWFLDQLHPNSTAYTVPLVARLTGTLDVAALRQSLDEIVRRHEVLRTTFTLVDGQPAQIIASAESEISRISFAQIDLSDVPTTEQDAVVQDRVHREFQQPFDLQRGPLVRATLLRLHPEGTHTEHVVILMIHHIIFDAWSQQVFMDELVTLYFHYSQPGARHRATPLPELPIQYADYARWQHRWLQEAGLEQQMGYWQQQLNDLPALQLMTDRPRAANGSFEGRHYDFELPDQCTTALHDLSQREGCTLFMTLLAAWQVLLARYTAQSDIVVGTPIANRTQAESQKLIGFFVNTLVLRTDLGGDPTFRQALHRVRDVCLQAYAHQDVPFDKLVEVFETERDMSRHPLFQVMFAYQHRPPAPPALPNLKLTMEPVQIELVKFDLNLTFMETPAGLAGTLKYRTDLFGESTIAQMAGQLQVLLRAITSDPDVRIADLPLLTADEHQALLRRGQATESYVFEDGLHQVFERQASRTPDAVAVTCEGLRLTYAELNLRANQLARHLQAHGVGPEVCVGLFVERSLDLIVGLLGVLKAGGAYVPLDPAQPPDRLAFMLRDADVAVLLTQEPLAPRLPTLPIPRVYLDVDAQRIAQYAVTAPATSALPDHPAYVIYTSGSTGTPKGVLVTHANVLRLFAATRSWFHFDARDVWTLFHSPAFDFSVWEIWGALLYGGTLVIVPYHISRSPDAFYTLLLEEGVTVLNQTPSAFRQLILAGADHIGSALALRYVIFGGEALELAMLQPWFARHGDRQPQLVNMYGITETTVHVTYRPLTLADLQQTASVIGSSIPDLDLYLLDQHLQPVPPGVPGEIYVGGEGLARGYLRRPALTSERFVPHPWGRTAGARLYRSGDLARYGANGELEYLGRIDQQVKIRGFRIELGEIEAVLARHPDVREGVVLVREDLPGDHRLVAYIVPAPAGRPSVDELRTFLGVHLPEYMIPSAFVTLDRLPLTVNGKLDRKALPSPDQARPALDETYTAPRSPLEHCLVELWQEVLGITTVGVHDNFFALGGNSIQAAVLVNQLQRILQEIIYVVAIFDAPTIAELATYLASRYPQSVARIEGVDLRPEEQSAVEADTPIGPTEIAQFLQRITPLRPRVGKLSQKNPPAVFILSPPRSGSTLLRVMLAGHPGLFAPPELELLSFNTLAERKAAFTGRDRFWLEGTIRAMMAIRACDAATAEQMMAEFEEQDLTVHAFYHQLQTWLGDRLLVDKTPSYALDPAILRRAEEDFTEARYIHLVRHPYGMIRSFEEAKLDQIFFRQPHSFTTRELAELIWLMSHQNILDFFKQIPAERQHTVSFEALVRQPEDTMQQLCAFLGLHFDPAMLQPYAENRQRMTDGPYAASRMLGDVKFHQHQGIDAAASERWKDTYPDDVLGEQSWQMAEQLGYARPQTPTPAAQPASLWMPIQPQPRTGSDRFPCSFAQQRLWFIDQLAPNSPAYNIFVALRLSGYLDQGALQRSLDTLVERHESLRTVFAVQDGMPVQVISPPQPVTIRIIDLRDQPVTQIEAIARQYATEEAQSPFDLAQGPLLRVLLLQGAQDSSVLVLNVHHIVSDGWSQRVLIQEMTSLYAAYSSDASAVDVLPSLPIQYADYAVWQRQWLQGEGLAAQMAYWQRQLADLPILGLPTDYPRPAIQTTEGRHYSVMLPNQLRQELEALSRREGVTLFVVLLAAFQILLMRYSGQDDVVVGTPVAGRNRAELEALIGFFVNTLVIRTDVSGNPTFHEVLQRVRQVTSEAYAHQDVPFEYLVETIAPDRELNRHPLFQVLFTFQNMPFPQTASAGLTWSALDIDSATAKFDLSLALVETPQGLQGGWEYNTSLFAPETIARIAAHLTTLLHSIVADPGQRVGALELLTEVERHQILFDWNRSEAEYPRDATLHQLIEAQVERTPATPAIVFKGSSLTYAELNARANQLAHYLRAQGVGPDVLVALCVERSLEMIVGMLAILKAGAAYLPLDPAYPAARIQYMLSHSRASVILTQAVLVVNLPNHQAQVFCLDADWHTLGEQPVTNPPRTVQPDHLAYVIYTSGSTGRPKGVMVTQRGVINLVYGLRAYFDDPAVQITGLITSISFDISVNQIFPTLIFGRTLHIIADDIKFNSRALLHYLHEQQIHLLDAVPSYMQTVLSEVASEQPPHALRYLLIGGEKLEPRLLQSVFGQLGANVAIVNIYGLTEISDINILGVIHAADVDQPITVGRPLQNNRIYILGRHQQPEPIGTAGEVYVAGESVSRGYVFRPELTAERFVPCPFEDGQRMVRTGDLGRWRADGTVEILGRIDHQVKIRGFRIELGEVEAVLLRHPGVEAAVVVARMAESRDTELVAYVVAQPGQTITSHELLEALRQSIPAYMLPSRIILLELLPTTANGKVDRTALSQLDEGEPARVTPFVAPRSMSEWRMAQLWEAVLARQPIGVTDNFFEIGGHSLLSVRLLTMIQQEFHVSLPLMTLFQAPTIERLVAVLQHDRSFQSWSALVPLQPAGDQRPFFCIHPIGGAALCYVELTRHLGTSRPIYGLQAHGLDAGQVPYEDIPTMARSYLEAIRAVQPEGPYLLGGWSLGGVIAFEMARQLLQQGQQVGLLALIDSAVPEPGIAAPEDTTLMIQFAHDLGRLYGRELALAADELCHLAPHEQLEYMLVQARQNAVVPPDIDLDDIRRLAAVYQANRRAFLRYSPAPLPLRIALLQAADRLRAQPQRDLAQGWWTLADDVSTHIVAGDHHSIMHPPYVQAVADWLHELFEVAHKSEGARRHYLSPPEEPGAFLRDSEAQEDGKPNVVDGTHKP
ncbi:MAG TPA: amino acid adenylation domain-containing protein [Herpetosiphonaceae bacterium]